MEEKKGVVMRREEIENQEVAEEDQALPLMRVYERCFVLFPSLPFLPESLILLSRWVMSVVCCVSKGEIEEGRLGKSHSIHSPDRLLSVV